MDATRQQDRKREKSAIETAKEAMYGAALAYQNACTAYLAAVAPTSEETKVAADLVVEQLQEADADMWTGYTCCWDGLLGEEIELMREMDAEDGTNYCGKR